MVKKKTAGKIKSIDSNLNPVVNHFQYNAVNQESKRGVGKAKCALQTEIS
jgi:hypothetical protein